jgi:hypothetical protein
MTTTPLSELFAPETVALPRRAAPRGPRWLREPLLHFVVLGGLLFAVDRALVGKNDDLRTIVVDGSVTAEAWNTFKTERGRDPTPKELDALHRVWLDNEVLYREGLAMQVDRGDQAIRERVIFKALSIVDSGVKLPPADDKTLRAYFQAHLAKYDEPARFDFEEAALSGKPTEAEVREFVTALNGGAPGDSRAGLRVFKGRPRTNVVDSYGGEFARTLEATPLKTWVAVKTREGWRAMRLDATTAPRPATFESFRGVVQHDWSDETASQLRTDAVRKLAKKYKIVYETPRPGSGDE